MNKLTTDIIQWIKQYFEDNANTKTKAVIGISGGKDSAICAALCAQALGKDKVVGVRLPNMLEDVEALEIIQYLGIKECYININDIVNRAKFSYTSRELSEQADINLPARIRMVMLYMIAQDIDGRVCNTCNLSESMVGYETLWGDSVGDFSPLGNLTVTEVLEIGKDLGLPDKFVYKTPSDGLSGKTDEDNLGISYTTIDGFIAHPEYLEELIQKKNPFALRYKELKDKSEFKRHIINIPTFTR